MDFEYQDIDSVEESSLPTNEATMSTDFDSTTFLAQPTDFITSIDETVDIKSFSTFSTSSLTTAPVFKTTPAIGVYNSPASKSSRKIYLLIIISALECISQCWSN